MVIELTDLTKRYDRPAVAGVTFSVAAGEVFGIVGRNGAGKSTTVECLAGLRRPDGGTLRVLGGDPASAAVRARIGVQLQQAALPDRMRVSEAMALFAAAYRRRASWRPLLEDWGLAGHERKTFGSLSGGQKQRLFVALALINSPDLMFLDEITTGLDPEARRETWGLVRRLKARGATVVIVGALWRARSRISRRNAPANRGRSPERASEPGRVAGTRQRKDGASGALTPGRAPGAVSVSSTS